MSRPTPPTPRHEIHFIRHRLDAKNLFAVNKPAWKCSWLRARLFSKLFPGRWSHHWPRGFPSVKAKPLAPGTPTARRRRWADSWRWG